jgi:DNA-binding beta-propeller fold protein YncE
MKCWVMDKHVAPHGTLTLPDALKFSCNAFFYQWGNKAGIDNIVATGKSLGLGEKTGVPLSGEDPGILPGPEWLARVSPTERWSEGYTANVASGTVSVLDLKKQAVLSSIKISGSTQRIAISPDDRWVFTADQTKPQLAVIETASNKVKHWIPLPGLGYGTAPTPDGHWLIVAVPSANKVAIVDLNKMEVAQSLDVPKAPQEVLVRPDGSEAYVSCDSSRKVAVIDIKKQKVSSLIDAGAGVDGLAWARTE